MVRKTDGAPGSGAYSTEDFNERSAGGLQRLAIGLEGHERHSTEHRAHAQRAYTAIRMITATLKGHDASLFVPRAPAISGS